MRHVATLKELYGDFYSPEHLLSYHRPWDISIGSRSIGKSTGWGIEFLWEYMKHGKRFIYLRRTDDEVKLTAPTALDSSAYILRDGGYPIRAIEAEKGRFYLINDKGKKEQCGMYFSLSKEHKYKSTNFGLYKYRNILYDEFISMNPALYLGNQRNITYEYEKALELYQTVDRTVGHSFTNSTRFVFIANLASYYNPIFIGLHIDELLRTDTVHLAPKIAPNGQPCRWTLEQTKAVKATSNISESFAYQLSDLKNQEYAYDNIAFDDSKNLVLEIKRPMKPLFNIAWNGDKYGVWYDDRAEQLYISKKKTQLNTVALTTNDQKINYALSLRPGDNVMMKMVRDYFMQGQVISETRRIRYIISNYLLLTRAA